MLRLPALPRSTFLDGDEGFNEREEGVAFLHGWQKKRARMHLVVCFAPPAQMRHTPVKNYT